MTKKVSGSKIHELMKKEGLSGKRLAEMTGISVSSIYRYIKGERNPSKANIDKIAKALDVNSKCLFESDEASRANAIFAAKLKTLGLKMTEKGIPRRPECRGVLPDEQYVLIPSYVGNRDFLEKNVLAWLWIGKELMSNKFDRKILKKIYQQLDSHKTNYILRKEPPVLSIKSFLPGSIDDLQKESFMVQDCYDLPLKGGEYTIVELYKHPTSFDIGFNQFFDFFIQCIPIIESLSQYPVVFITRGYISTDTFPEDLFYMDDKDKQIGKAKIPVKRVLKREPHRVLKTRIRQYQ